MTGVTIESTSYRAWDDCLRVSNDVLELVVTVGLGPRVLACGFVDGENLFFTDEEREPMRNGYVLHGGHRLWHAPEDEDRTYVPDEDPVEWTGTDHGVRLVQDTEEGTGIQKTVSIALAEEEPAVEVTHELTNEGVWTVELAPWAITVMDGGGTAVVPLSRGDPEGLLPDRSLTLWPYTDMSDDRLTFGDEAVRVDQTADGEGPLKVGASAADEWAAYVVDGTAFVKEFVHDPAATYPDRGSGVEVYASADSLELETLGPVEALSPGESAVHTETWRLVDGVDSVAPADVRDALE
ncbi:MAG: hypothetical protein V5A44_10725 [Haloarculaceae archaeon]